MPEIAIAAESPRQESVVALVAALDRYLLELYPADTCHLLDIAELEAPDLRFFVARKDGVPVGCAALRVVTKTSAAPTRSQASRAASSVASESAWTPVSPWIGSSSTAAVPAWTAASIASGVGSTTTKPGTSGANGACLDSCGVADSEP